MAEPNPTSCGKCGVVLDSSRREPCPACGSARRAIPAAASTKMPLKQQTGTKQKRKGIKRPVLETLSGDDLTKSTGEWAKKERVIDRTNDKYFEHVEHAETGEVLHHCEEPLSEHFSSANERRAKSDQASATSPDDVASEHE